MTAGLRLLPSPAGSERWIAVDKPAGRSVHGPGSLLDEIRKLLGPQATPVHRLDRITSGVLLVARDAEALRLAHAGWGSVQKVYVARTRGTPEPPEGAVELPLLENRTGKPKLLLRALRARYGPAAAGQLVTGRRVRDIPPLPPPGRTAVHPAGRPARTGYRLTSPAGEAPLVELSPREGRMHQVRVHLAAIGTPVLGDPLYDPQARPEEVPLLCAARLAWHGPPGMPDGTVFLWEAPPPSL